MKILFKSFSDKDWTYDVQTAEIGRATAGTAGDKVLNHGHFTGVVNPVYKVTREDIDEATLAERQALV